MRNILIIVKYTQLKGTVNINAIYINKKTLSHVF